MKKFAVVASLFLSNISVVFAGTPLTTFTTLLLVALIIINTISRTKKSSFKLPSFMIFFFIMIIVGVLRNNNEDTNINLIVYQLAKFLLFSIAFFQTLNIAFSKKINMKIVFKWMIYIPLFFHILINVLLLSVGYEPEINDVIEGKKNDFVLLTALGFSYNPAWSVVEGFKGSRSIIGLFLTLSLVGLKVRLLSNKILYFNIFLSVIILLILDTRAALLYPFFIFFCFLFLFKKDKAPKILLFLPFITVFGSNLLLLFLSTISSFSDLSFLSRSSEDFSTGNSRSFIWLISFMEFINFKLIHIIGYGEYGHYKSGASLLWSDIFAGNEGEETKTPHSLFYSVLFDYGYLGLSLLLFLQFKIINIIRGIWSTYYTESVLVASFFIYWIFIGVTETFFGFYSPNILYVFVSFCMFTCSLRYYNSLSFKKK